jgi:hypothetical protein
LKEDYGNWMSLKPTEPLLSTGKLQEGKCSSKVQQKELNYFADAKSINGVQNQMYTKSASFLKALKIIKCR